MKTTSRLETVLAAMTAVVCVSVHAADLYVDRSNPVGTYASINAAIRAANDYDTIWVRPGVYDNDPAVNVEAESETEPDIPAIVYVTKPLNIIATSSDPAATMIVGRLDPNAVARGDRFGAGPNAVRCVRFSAAASAGAQSSVLKGFTICNGGCATSATTYDNDAGQPGGVAGRTSVLANFYVTDCVVSNCVGVRGGLVRKGSYVRCRFSNGHSYAGCNLGREIALMSCLVTHMAYDGTGIVLEGSAIVNTTFADMLATPYYRSSSSIPLYNCVITSCGGFRFDEGTSGAAYNSLLPYPEMAYKKDGCLDEQTDAISYPLIAPLAGDFRLRAGTPVCGLGNAAHIETFFSSAPESVEIYKDLAGRAIPAEGPINPGCYQETAVAMSGGLQLGCSDAPVYVDCDGYLGEQGSLYAFGTEPFQSFRISARAGSAPAFHFRIGGYYRYPDMDDSIRMMVPGIGSFVTNVMTSVTKEYWVDPEKGVDEAGAGSAGNPFKTLQYACDNCQQDGRTLIHAAAGAYAEGGMDYGGHTNRVTIWARRHARIKGAGRGKSFLLGCADMTSVGLEHQGMGPTAVRCVLNDYDTDGCVQGFTLRDGYADYSSSNEDNRQFSGGLFWAGYINDRQHVLADCELVGGMAFRGSLAYGGTVVRCLINECDGVDGGVARSCVFEECVFNDTLYHWMYSPNVSEVSFYACTLKSRDSSPVYHQSSNLKLENCIVLAGSSMPVGVAELTNVRNTYFCGYEVPVSYPETVRFEDPKVADVSSGDYRLRVDSSAITDGFVPSADYWMQVQTDVNGDPVLVSNGKLLPGALQQAVEVVNLAKPRAGTFDVDGSRALDVGETITVNYSDGGTRNFIGLSVDGELNAGVTSISYTAGIARLADGSCKPPVVISAVYATDWYVNAVSGDDENNGFTPQTAWKTLAKLQSVTAFDPGDVVHAAAGDYAEKTVETTIRQSFVEGYNQLPSRVEVPANVTLVADEGPEKTFITGEESSNPYGIGPGAVRCASICSGGRLERFTLRGGRAFDEVTDGDQFCGGGVFAGNPVSGEPCGIAYGCIITNCVAYRGGAARGGKIVNCKIIDCGGLACAPAGSMSWFLGCHIDGCRYNHQLMRNSYFVGYCTFGPNNEADGSCAVNEVELGYGGVVNCVFMNKLSALRPNAEGFYRGCKFLQMDIDDPAQLASLGEGCEQFDSIESSGLDGAGVSLRKDAVPVDGAIAVDVSVLREFGGLDCAFSQRIFNGSVDAGCYEFDWRNVYSKNVGATVDVADPQVVESEGMVLVREGRFGFSFPETSGERNTRYSIAFEVTGTGTLQAYRNGCEIGAYTASGPVVLKFRNKDVVNEMTFVYNRGTGDVGGALFGETSAVSPGFSIMIR